MKTVVVQYMPPKKKDWKEERSPQRKKKMR